MEPGKVLHIAIVDNSKLLREELSGLLSKKEFIVTILAEHGKDLLNQLEKATKLPDLCICDINMPVMDGFQTAQAVKAKYPQIKFLSFSTDTSNWVRTEVLKSGADAFMSKHSTIHEYVINIGRLFTSPWSNCDTQ